MKNNSNSRHRGNNNNRSSYSYPQRVNRQWDTLDNRDEMGPQHTGGSYDRRNNYGGYTSDYEYPGQSVDNARNNGWNEERNARNNDWGRQHSGSYNERMPGSNYSSRHAYGSHNSSNRGDDRNFFERAGDRIRQKFNDWTDDDRSYDRDYEARQSYNSNYNDRDDYNNSYDRYNGSRGYSASDSDRDNYGHGNNRGYGNFYGSGGGSRFADDRYNEDGYSNNTRGNNGHRGFNRSSDDFAW